jgi:putative membrane protein
MTIRLHRAANLAAFAGVLIFAGACAAADQKSSADKRFVTEAAQGGMAEVQLGKLATEKASSADVKQFGQRMVDDHTKANDQLKSIASQQNITLPNDMGAKNQAEYDRLSKLSGDAFDKAYMKHMLTDHRKDVAEFKKEASSGKDDAVKNFASSTVPMLEEHLKMAEDINGKLSGTSSADRMSKEKTTTTETKTKTKETNK